MNNKITDFGYMLLHEKGNKIYYVAYPNKEKKYGCLVFIQRSGFGIRHLVLDIEAQFFSAAEAVAIAEFEIETIQLRPKKFDIQD